MDRDSLKEFIILSETLSFSEAAEQLYMSQPALSKRISALEKELGEPLFIRDTRNTRLSAFGSEFLPYARQVLTSYESADMFINLYKTKHVKKITLGTIPNLECFHIDEVFLGFKKAHPEIQLDLKEAGLPELDNMFGSGKINLYCACDITLRDGAEFIYADSGYLVTLLNKNDPLAAGPVVTPESLKDRNLLLPSESDPFYAPIAAAFSAKGIKPQVVYQGASLSSISLVRSGIGIAFLPVEIAKKYIDSDICLVPFEPSIGYNYGLGYRERSRLSTSERTFVDFVREFFPEKNNSQDNA